LHRSFYVAWFDKFPCLLRVVRPYSGRAIGLQFDPHLDSVRIRFVHTLVRFLGFGQDSEQILHVVTDFVRDHIGLRELTGLASDIAGTKSTFKVAKERGVEINLAIVGTVAALDLSQTSARR
jgi:hypothetical protein